MDDDAQDAEDDVTSSRYPRTAPVSPVIPASTPKGFLERWFGVGKKKETAQPILPMDSLSGFVASDLDDGVFGAVVQPSTLTQRTEDHARRDRALDPTASTAAGVKPTSMREEDHARRDETLERTADRSAIAEPTSTPKSVRRLTITSEPLSLEDGKPTTTVESAPAIAVTDPTSSDLIPVALPIVEPGSDIKSAEKPPVIVRRESAADKRMSITNEFIQEIIKDIQDDKELHLGEQQVTCTHIGELTQTPLYNTAQYKKDIYDSYDFQVPMPQKDNLPTLQFGITVPKNPDQKDAYMNLPSNLPTTDQESNKALLTAYAKCILDAAKAHKEKTGSNLLVLELKNTKLQHEVLRLNNNPGYNFIARVIEPHKPVSRLKPSGSSSSSSL
jgi:hypothetical protein